MLKFSIIIPVYNVAKYLEECILSVMNQGFPRDQYEVICIDDGSTDGSSEMLDRLGEKYNNLKAIHQTNQGVSAARNTGLSLASGEYIWFIDADDIVASNSLAIIDQNLGDKPDRLKFGSYPCYEDISIGKCEGIQKTVKAEDSDFYKDIVVWNCVLKRKYIEDNKILFSTKLSYSEDSVFMATFLVSDPSARGISNVLYFHRQNASSVVSLHDENHETKRIESAIEAAKEYRNLLLTKGKYNRIQGAFGDQVLRALYLIQKQSKEREQKYLNEMRSSRLFPCRIKRDYTDSELFKDRKVYHFIYSHLNTRWGYMLMKAVTQLAGIKRSIFA